MLTNNRRKKASFPFSMKTCPSPDTAATTDGTLLNLATIPPIITGLIVTK